MIVLRASYAKEHILVERLTIFFLIYFVGRLGIFTAVFMFDRICNETKGLHLDTSNAQGSVLGLKSLKQMQRHYVPSLECLNTVHFNTWSRRIDLTGTYLGYLSNSTNQELYAYDI